MPLLHLTLLGRFQRRLRGGPPVVLVRTKAQALLAYLAVEPVEAHRREKVAARLWGNSNDQQARHSLRQARVCAKFVGN